LSVYAFTHVLVVGAAALALWIMVRYGDLGPRTIVRAIAHVIVATVLLRLLLPHALDSVDAIGVPAADYVKAFGIALPLFIYAFLSGGWVTRAAMGLLR
jgi:hypothetical protein